MAATLFNTLYDYVIPEVPGCTPELALLHIRLAAIDFCDRSDVWQGDCASVNVVAGTSTYTISSPDNTADILRAITVKYDGETIDPVDRTQLNGSVWKWETETGTPSMCLQETPTSIQLVPVPSVAITAGLIARVSMKPKIDSTGIEAWVMNKHFMTIAHGALESLLKMPKKPWTDPAMSMSHGHDYRAGIASAREEALLGIGRGRQYTRAVW